MTFDTVGRRGHLFVLWGVNLEFGRRLFDLFGDASATTNPCPGFPRNEPRKRDQEREARSLGFRTGRLTIGADRPACGISVCDSSEGSRERYLRTMWSAYL
jgi:hypothetical protein